MEQTPLAVGCRPANKPGIPVYTRAHRRARRERFAGSRVLCAGVDNVSISIDHSASAFGEHFQPYTIIRRYGDDSNQAEFDRADSNVFSLAELLGFASVDLDEPMDGSFNAKWVDTRSAAVGEVVGPEGLSSGNFPRPRITGERGAPTPPLRPPCAPLDLELSLAPLERWTRRRQIAPPSTLLVGCCL